MVPVLSGGVLDNCDIQVVHDFRDIWMVRISGRDVRFVRDVQCVVCP